MPRLVPLALLAALMLGCAETKPSASGPAKDKKDDHDHSDHGSTLADFGPHHARLAAHIGKDESNLEISFETTDKEPKPVGLPLTGFKATAKREGDEKTYDLDFKPGPKDERKTDKDGECSRFEAEAKWMKPTDKISVTASIDYAGKPRKVEWKEFVPKDAAHKH